MRPEPSDPPPQKARPHVARHVLAEGRFARVVAQTGWEWVERTNMAGAVVIVAVTEDGRLILVEQYRIPMARPVIEMPAGLAGDVAGSEQEALAEAACRELLEETGYAAARMEYLTEGPASAGLSNEVYTMFLAADARRVGPGGGDGAENIRVHLVALDEVPQWLEERRRQGVLVDPRIYAGLFFAHNHRSPRTTGE
jgi:ADP-ribose pyrophosphatase